MGSVLTERVVYGFKGAQRAEKPTKKGNGDCQKRDESFN